MKRSEGDEAEWSGAERSRADRKDFCPPFLSALSDLRLPMDERADILPNTSAFAGPCCGGLSEQAALARYPTSAQCRLKEGQEWLASLRTEQRLKTQQGWRGQVRLCGGMASDAGASSVKCYVAWHRPPIHEYFCDTRNMQVDFSTSYWGPWSRKKALLPLARRGALRGRCAPSTRRWGHMRSRG